MKIEISYFNIPVHSKQLGGLPLDELADENPQVVVPFSEVRLGFPGFLILLENFKKNLTFPSILIAALGSCRPSGESLWRAEFYLS